MHNSDTIPNDAKIEVTPTYITDDVVNLADKEEIVDEVKNTIRDYEDRYIGQRDEWVDNDTGIWNLCDAAFRSHVNDSIVQREKSKGANEPSTWERAKIGSTLFYRQVAQKASNLYAVMTSKEQPFKYDPLHDGSDAGNADEQAEKMNLLAKWSMKSDMFNLKSIDFSTQIYKYGNIPVLVEWCQKIGIKKDVIPVYDDDANVIDERVDEEEIIVENRPKVSVLPIESVYADVNIGNIAEQSCVIVTAKVSLPDIIDGIRSGLYRDDLLKDLNHSHQWDGYSGEENRSTKETNRDMEGTAPYTGQYLKREVWVRVPIDDEKWDEEKNIPELYRVTMFGNQISNSVVARIERNQEPGDVIPIEMIHANPDDNDYLYHISPYEVIRSNMAAEITIQRQIIDNNTLVNKPLTWHVRGEVTGNDFRFAPDNHLELDNPNAFGFYNIRDVSQPSLQLLEYMKDDSNTANFIDKNMVGDSFGARTSASEATTISGNSRRPNLVNIEYILEQYLGFVARRYKALWEQYGRREQVVQITDKNDRTVYIKPKDISGEFDVVINIVDEIRDNEVKAQRMINFMGAIANTPLVNQFDWASFGKDLSEYMMGTDKYVVEGADGDAEEMARNNIALMLQAGEVPQFGPGMNLRKHLDVYKAERLRWMGREDQNQFIRAILDPVIAQLELRVSQPQAPQQQQVVPEAVAGGQQMSAALGGNA